MPKLKGLKGISVSEIECDFFKKSYQISKILSSGKAATTAADNGALNIWKDDDGFIRCESMQYYAVLDTQKFKKLIEVKKWANEWLLKIQ